MNYIKMSVFWGVKSNAHVFNEGREVYQSNYTKVYE